MKFILLILGLAAITAGSTFFVAPQLREFHEGYLKGEVSDALKDHYADVEIEMDHLHAKKIHIKRIPEEGETKASVTAHVVEVVQSVYGATVDPKDVTVEFEFASSKPKLVKPVKPDVPQVKPEVVVEKVEPKVDPMPKVAPKPEPKVEPKPEPKPVLASSEIYVEWNERKNEIRVDGKMSNTSQRDAFVSMLEKQYKPAVITNNLMVSKDNVAQSGKVLELQNYLPKIIKSCAGKGSVRIVDHPASLTLNGTLKSKADFESLNNQLKPLMKSLSDKPLKVMNKLKYHAAFVIEKNDKQRAIILSGYANRNNSVNLSSYIKRYTQDTKNKYKFQSDIVPDARSAEYQWTPADQKLLDNHLKNAVHGKIYYENDMVEKVTGVTADAGYHRMLKERFSDKATQIELTLDVNAKPETPMAKSKVEESAKSKQVEAASKLRAELKNYKIYFDSGKKSVATKYDPLLRDIAKIISKSKDKKSVIVLGGFADHTGNPVANEKLSKERAASVQEKLVELGVPITRTVVEFFGAEGADVDKKLSRRVEIRVR